MASTNTVTLIGNIGKDLNLLTFDSGNKRINLSLATSESYKNAKGDQVSPTQWHNVVAWNQVAEKLSENCKKGDRVMVKGSIQYRSYKDKEGVDRYITEILVASYEKIERAAPLLDA